MRCSEPGYSGQTTDKSLLVIDWFVDHLREGIRAVAGGGHQGIQRQEPIERYQIAA